MRTKLKKIEQNSKKSNKTRKNRTKLEKTRKNSKKLEKNFDELDCISREKAIEEADKLCLETGYDNEKVIEMLNDLPSVIPQPRKITIEDVEEYCTPRCLTIVSNSLLYELTHPKIKALEQEPKIKVLDRDEVTTKLGTVDIYQASAWVTLIKDLEYLGLKICEVKE